ncbi:MAG: hypothetical protein COT43_07215 [Candidatus Marinimicrobia bacterium CG08_land_8_20_14_0_20_45_22]|nr:MAG: hypothetical protein COT43_07215 [Candidatus Marinimicrobia bacterium CG08_land_8_20_14_0_20_45_22]
MDFYRNLYNGNAMVRFREPSRYPGKIIPLGIILAFLVLLQICGEHHSTKYNENLPPETSIFISSSGILNPTQSVQVISWDGRDPDGFVIGFYYRWKSNADSTEWIFTKAHSDTFELSISGDTASYIFQIKAIDDDSLADPTPASQLFPIKNTIPKIGWITNRRIPDTTFTVASFTWNATDLDGDSTITNFEWALDDTMNWTSISGILRTVTINEDNGLTEGDHCFYLRAVDIAGAKSEIIRMPEDMTWYVKEPVNGYLLVDDYSSETVGSGYPDKYYKGLLKSLIGNFNYWNIEEQFPASMTQFTETLKLFDRVVWYTDLIMETDDHFIAAQVAIPEVLDDSGKVIYICQFNTGFGSQGDPLAFTPVDALGDYYSRISSLKIFSPQTDIQIALSDTSIKLPELKTTTNIFGTYSVSAKEGSVVLYRYDGKVFVILGRNDNTGEYDMVFSGAPLHLINGNSNLDDFFDIILNDVFK